MPASKAAGFRLRMMVSFSSIAGCPRYNRDRYAAVSGIRDHTDRAAAAPEPADPEPLMPGPWLPEILPRRPTTNRRGAGSIAPVVVVSNSARCWSLHRSSPLLEPKRIGIGHAVIAARFSRIIGILARDQLILGVEDLAVAIDPEALGDRPCRAAFAHFAGFEIDRPARELALGFWRRRRERGSRRDIGPHRLHHRLEDRNRNAAAGRAAAERAALAVGVVVADPDRHGDVIGEAYEPGVVLLVGGAGLARDKGRKARDRARGAARQHALQHGLELIEGGAVDRADADRRFRIVAIDDEAVALDRIRSHRATGARLHWRSPHRRPPDRSAAPAARRARMDNSACIRDRSAPPSQARTADRGSLPGCPRCRRRAGARWRDCASSPARGAR